jgi:NTE family protein
LSDADTHPQPTARHSGRIALCLSGGGYRAALFHLGGLRRLDELGVLSKVDTISSVSGGSVMAAQIAGHLVANRSAWAQPGDPVAGFAEGIAGPMVEQAKRDIRTRAALARVWPPWNLWSENAQVDVLARELATGSVGMPLAQVPERPRFVFCSTDAVFRVLWTFDSGTHEMGDSNAGRAPLGDFTIARAAAASCCLPLLFQPMRIDAELTGGASDCGRRRPEGPIEIVDGGIYDDLGVEPVWGDHATVLVSDGGPAFKAKPRIPPLAWRDLRYAITLMEQASEVRKRWFLARLRHGELAGGYWGITALPSDYGHPPVVDPHPADPYPDELIRCWIAFVRDDLDAFSEGERAVLQNHGYLMADIAVHATAPGLIENDSRPAVPFPEYMDEARAKAALKDSDKPRLWR